MTTQHVLEAKLKKRYSEYCAAVSQKDILSQNNALEALMDECDNKEPLAHIAREFVKKNLNISFD